jgi:hypothetical protein
LKQGLISVVLAVVNEFIPDTRRVSIGDKQLKSTEHKRRMNPNSLKNLRPAKKGERDIKRVVNSLKALKCETFSF